MKILKLVSACLSLLLLTHVNGFLDCLREADLEKLNYNFLQNTTLPTKVFLISLT